MSKSSRSMVPSRWFVFLRAINVGERRVTNEQMLAPFDDLGFTGVAAYQAAGNITFRAPGPIDTVALDEALAAAYGFAAPAFVRSADELQRIVDGCPFTDEQLAATEGRVQLTFLAAAPDERATAAVHDLVPDADRVVVDGTQWFWLPRTGVSGSQLPVARIETLLGPMTMRTLGTVQRMLAKFPA